MEDLRCQEGAAAAEVVACWKRCKTREFPTDYLGDTWSSELGIMKHIIKTQ